jgi:hypothetical protein
MNGRDPNFNALSTDSALSLCVKIRRHLESD